MSPVRLSLENRAPDARTYAIEWRSPAGGTLLAPMFPLTIPAGEERTIVVESVMPAAAFTAGRAEAALRVLDGVDFAREYPLVLTGPLGGAAP
jgi:hypothetical protein